MKTKVNCYSAEADLVRSLMTRELGEDNIVSLNSTCWWYFKVIIIIIIIIRRFHITCTSIVYFICHYNRILWYFIFAMDEECYMTKLYFFILVYFHHDTCTYLIDSSDVNSLWHSILWIFHKASAMLVFSWNIVYVYINVN